MIISCRQSLTFIYYSQKMTYSKDQLIDALQNEYEYLCHDDFDPENDQTTEEYREELQNYSYEELVEETTTGEGYTLKEFMENWA